MIVIQLYGFISEMCQSQDNNEMKGKCKPSSSLERFKKKKKTKLDYH